MSGLLTESAGTQIYIWQYRVRDGRIEEFVRRYDSGRDWSRLFAQSPGYRGTALLRDPAISNLFVTIDSWDSSTAFETFKRECADAYTALDRECEALTIDETFIGAYLNNSTR